jgi:hypothetical protein
VDKVVAFLEKYAEWVALGVASLFLMYMVYANVIAPDALRSKVGNAEVFPGEVDQEIQRQTVARLTQAMEAPAGDVVRRIEVADYGKEFAQAMGPNRPRMGQEHLVLANSGRPRLPGGAGPEDAPKTGGIEIATLPAVPPAIPVASITGSSLVAPPPQPPAVGEDGVEVPAPAPQEPAVALANALDKRWVMLEWKFPLKALAVEWKKAFPQPAKIPTEAMATVFLDVEVEREELVGPGQWANKVVLQPLPLVPRPDWPKGKDPEAEEQYRAWAEANQLNIVEPPFYQILKGDKWYVPSIGQPQDPNAVDPATVANEPFDPANPPNRKLTPAEQAQVFIHKKKIRDEEEKAKAAERKARMGGGGGAGRTTGGGAGDAGRRSVGGGGGGYAPLPEQWAGGPGMSDNGGRRPPTQGGNAGRPAPTPAPGLGGRRPPTRNDRGDSPAGGNRSTGTAAGGAFDGSAAVPVVGPDGQIQNSLLTGPFDPTKVTPDAKGNLPDLPIWAYDDTAQPGKTYRYRMRLKLKNPIYHTFGLTAKGQEKLSEQFVIESPFSEWKEVTAPRNTEFFFAAKRQGIGNRNVSAVTVDVFKNERGQWAKETFTVAPGDSIGLPKGATDFTTGNTVVDLRLDTREKDVQILVADGTGSMETRSLESDLNDPWYLTLQDRIKAQEAAAAADAAAAGNGEVAAPALINPVGGDGGVGNAGRRRR